MDEKIYYRRLQCRKDLNLNISDKVTNTKKNRNEKRAMWFMVDTEH